MLKTVKLYGHLGKKFGKVHRLDVANTRDAIRAMSALFPGFQRELVGYRPGYRVWVDDAALSVRDELSLPGRAEIKIVPQIAGAGNGIGQIFLGIALVVAAIYAPELLPEMGMSEGFATAVGGMALSFGATLILGGLSQMLAKNPQSAPSNKDNTTSYLFNGPVNTTAQGNPVSILYGRLIIGSQVVSASIASYDIAIAPNATPSPNQVTYKGVM